MKHNINKGGQVARNNSIGNSIGNAMQNGDNGRRTGLARQVAVATHIRVGGFTMTVMPVVETIDAGSVISRADLLRSHGAGTVERCSAADLCSRLFGKNDQESFVGSVLLTHDESQALGETRIATLVIITSPLGAGVYTLGKVITSAARYDKPALEKMVLPASELETGLLQFPKITATTAEAVAILRPWMIGNQMVTSSIGESSRVVLKECVTFLANELENIGLDVHKQATALQWMLRPAARGLGGRFEINDKRLKFVQVGEPDTGEREITPSVAADAMARFNITLPLASALDATVKAAEEARRASEAMAAAGGFVEKALRLLDDNGLLNNPAAAVELLNEEFGFDPELTLSDEAGEEAGVAAGEEAGVAAGEEAGVAAGEEAGDESNEPTAEAVSATPELTVDNIRANAGDTDQAELVIECHTKCLDSGIGMSELESDWSLAWESAEATDGLTRQAAAVDAYLGLLQQHLKNLSVSAPVEAEA